ncbi:hypothetical protein NBRC116591_25290 [Sessilibacter corallicola]|uniref:Uncharacterized protein n=1 Tax=Sessilibacter corallicola TaxID=2904075 RepID=A0ABQ0AAP1_9GAMM
MTLVGDAARLLAPLISIHSIEIESRIQEHKSSRPGAKNARSIQDYRASVEQNIGKSTGEFYQGSFDDSPNGLELVSDIK